MLQLHRLAISYYGIHSTYSQPLAIVVANTPLKYQLKHFLARLADMLANCMKHCVQKLF